MQIVKPRVQHLPATILVTVGVLVWLLSNGDAAAGGPYTDSAHGDATYGVKRQGTTYSRGQCTHCHDTYDPSICGVNPLMLFDSDYDTSAFCLKCHTDTGSVQVGGIINKDYSGTFGGGTGGPQSIYEALNNSTPCTSSHNLSDVLTFAQTKWPSTFGDTSNACNVCHNFHIAGANKQNPGDPGFSAISRPTAHTELWGDSPGETMKDYAISVSGIYQAPYYVGGSNYEPANDGTADGSNMPDYVTFCTDCHNTTDTIFSTPLNRNLMPIDWSAGGDKHGGYPAHFNDSGGLDYHMQGGEEGVGLRVPYDDAAAKDPDDPCNYVLSCTDCHEPHGAEGRSFLLRRYMNGESVDPETSMCQTEIQTKHSNTEFWNTPLVGYSDANLKPLCDRCHYMEDYGVFTGGCLATGSCHGFGTNNHYWQKWTGDHYIPYGAAHGSRYYQDVVPTF